MMVMKGEGFTFKHLLLWETITVGSQVVLFLLCHEPPDTTHTSF